MSYLGNRLKFLLCSAEECSRYHEFTSICIQISRVLRFLHLCSNVIFQKKLNLNRCSRSYSIADKWMHCKIYCHLVKKEKREKMLILLMKILFSPSCALFIMQGCRIWSVVCDPGDLMISHTCSSGTILINTPRRFVKSNQKHCRL